MSTSPQPKPASHFIKIIKIDNLHNSLEAVKEVMLGKVYAHNPCYHSKEQSFNDKISHHQPLF